MKSPIDELQGDTRKLAEHVAQYFRNADISPELSIQMLRDVADNIEKAYKQWVNR